MSTNAVTPQRNTLHTTYECLAPLEIGLRHLGGNIAGGDYRTYTPPVWGFLLGMAATALSRDGIITVLDVGCGEGDAAAWFQRHGCSVHAYDGWNRNVEVSRSLGVQAHEHDLQGGVIPLAEVPAPAIAWCCEVLEHVAPAYADNVVHSLCLPGVVVIGVTAAPPGRGGHHHVNCQPPAYWDSKFAECGFEPNRAATTYSKILLGAYAKEQGTAGHYWRLNGTIYVKR